MNKQGIGKCVTAELSNIDLYVFDFTFNANKFGPQFASTKIVFCSLIEYFAPLDLITIKTFLKGANK